MMVNVNLITVVLSVVASMAIGFFWYSPMWMGKPWMKLKGYSGKGTKKEQKEMGKWYMLSAVVAFITAYVLFHLVAQAEYFYEMDRFTTGLLTAFWGWLGLVMPVQVTHTIFGDKKWGLFLIDTGYQLVSLLAMGAIIGMWA